MTGVRIVLVVFGIAAVVIGGVFIGQGAGVIPGSFMTGDRTWLYIGLLVAVVGLVLIGFGARRRRSPQR